MALDPSPGVHLLVGRRDGHGPSHDLLVLTGGGHGGHIVQAERTQDQASVLHPELTGDFHRCERSGGRAWRDSRTYELLDDVARSPSGEVRLLGHGSATPGEQIAEYQSRSDRAGWHDVAVAVSFRSEICTVCGRDSAGRMMPSGATPRLVALCFDANDPLRLARFWADALKWDLDAETQDEIGLAPTDDTSFRILLLPVPTKFCLLSPL